MFQALKKRLEQLEAPTKRSCPFKVYYKNGKTETVRAGAIIELTLEHSEEIERFEENKPRRRNGVLEELCNDLLAD